MVQECHSVLIVKVDNSSVVCICKDNPQKELELGMCNSCAVHIHTTELEPAARVFSI